MITSTRAVGGRSTRPFVRGRKLIPQADLGQLNSWVLTNGTVSFTFTEDPLKGACLTSWTRSDFTEEVVNKNKSLWQINCLINYHQTNDGDVRFNHYSVYPSFKHFVNISQVPEVSEDGTKRFTFVWRQVPYDKKQPSLTCDVTLIASLRPQDEHMDMSLSMSANQSYPADVLARSCVVHSIHFPGLSWQTPDDDTVNEEMIFSVPLGKGFTYKNPHKYLRSPRYLGESFQYSFEATRAYYNTLPPVGISLKKGEFGNPGWIAIPAMIYGNTDTREATLIYAMDQQGTNPKAIQWYADDRNLHLMFYHNSDHQVDPYGIGGYDRDYGTVDQDDLDIIITKTYSIVNAPTWTLRIRPFKTNTKWVDWEGYRIYREEAVPEQVEHGWLPDTFYNRYQQGELDLRYGEMPMVMNSFGYLSGDTLNTARASQVYRNLYKESVNPNLTTDPIFPSYITPNHLNYVPKRETGANQYTSQYYSWEDWTSKPLGESYGPEGFKSPDMTGMNSGWATGFQALLTLGDLAFSYIAFPFAISSGSNWNITHSGMDLAAKTLWGESALNTNEDYRKWAYSGSTAALFSTDFIACLMADAAYNHAVDVAGAVAAKGMGAYHDTLGLWHRACYAHSHTYMKDGQVKVVSHPRGNFSRYSIEKQMKWLSGFSDAQFENIPSNWVGGTNDAGYSFRQCSEFPSDLNLKFVPTSLSYEAPKPLQDSVVFNEIADPRPDAVSNNIAGTPIDTLSDATIAALLAISPSTTHWSCEIASPNWLQRCPGFHIAHNQRSISNEWSVIFASNSYPNFLSNTYPTGVGTYGQILQSATGEDIRRMDWASWAISQWPHVNRMSVWHPNSTYGVFDGRFSGIQDDENLVFYSGVWSGYTEGVVNKIFRLQAYNPDYIYHGTLEHPLEDWTVDTSNICPSINALRRAQYPNNDPIDEPRLGVDKVMHTVRRHRSSDNLLLIFGNWFSGTSTFSASFNPAAYNITNGYQVYELDINTSEHGTRTLNSIVAAGAPYTIDLSLDQFEFSVLEIEVNNTSLASDLFADLKTDYTPIRYSYDVEEVSTNGLTLAYSYGSSVYGEVVPPFEGYRSPSTQQILNNLPQWMKMRQSYDSRGWKLVNSWGMNFDNVLNNVTKNILDLNLVTTDSTYLRGLNYIDIDSEELLEVRSPRNLLFNSSFAMKDVSRTRLPAGWESYLSDTDVRLDYKSSPVTPVSLVSDSGVLKVGQQVILNNTLVDSLVASVYVLCNSSDVQVILHASIEKTDGTSISQSATLSNRSSEWIRLVLPIAINSQVYRINYSILTDCDGMVSVAAPQLELSSISRWSCSAADTLPYYNTVSRFNSVSSCSLEPTAKKIPLFTIGVEKDFLDAGVPTRVEKVPAPAKTLQPFVNQAYGRKVDQLQEITRTEFAVDQDQVIERAISPTPFDVYGRYDLRDLRFYENLEYGTRDDSSVTITPLATAIRKEWLYVVCSEEYNGSMIYTLKIARPLPPPNGEEYLECVIDFDLDLNFDTDYGPGQITDTVASISFSDVDPSYMLVTTENNLKIYYKLYFDYYYFNPTRNRLYTIENYPNSKLFVI